MFTTQHYLFLAQRINTALRVIWNSDKPDGIQVYTLLSFAEMLADTLATDNAIFNRDLFYDAICANTPYSMSNLDSYQRSYLGGIDVLERNIDPALRKLVKEMKECTCKGTLIPTFCAIHNDYSRA